ncbi:NACHT domain-containing protein [Moorena sp. SIO3I6]|uniref:NACHT domain-containing protein n=1 Tax=Moorena sp. SIO3I6 TaxID=2607831 RepID=UPI0013FB9307|nr:NACHT domain-containing protein [Moorena sp. SIO3I6]NEP23933.1 NACHT domain-containing protein [Moorena sp. SIO3I6]
MSDLTGLIKISSHQDSFASGDVVFVHGLGGDASSTWHPKGKRNDDNFWPVWLGKDQLGLNIWSFGYDAQATNWKSNSSMPLFDQASNLLDWLDIHDIGKHPLVFITHSMGGLLVKKMLSSAKNLEKYKGILEQTKGIVFLATPHTGSHLANLIDNIGVLARTTVSVEELKAHHPQLRELNEWYRQNARSLGIATKVYYETLPVQGILVVDPDSANPGIEGVNPVAMPDDHISICKPESQNSQVYLGVKKFIEECLKNSVGLDNSNGTREKKNRSILEILEKPKGYWQDKLASLEQEYHSTTSASSKFELKKQIQECRTELIRIEEKLTLARNPARYKFLKSVKSEVERLLDQRLYQETLINLKKESRPKKVRRPRDDYHYQQNELLPSETRIIEFFDKKAVSGKLLILGEAGSGKTVTLLELTKSLISRAEQDPSEPIPVMLSLSSWKNQKIEEWLVAESCYLYHGVSEIDVRKLLEKHQLLPLLDNLDELNKNQFKCVEAINNFLTSNYKSNYLVVCSRLTEYERCFTPLQLNGCVCLKPLHETQIQYYFESIKRVDIWQSIQVDEQLIKLAKNPLFLHILTEIYTKSSIEELKKIKDKENQHCYLFNDYLDSALKGVSSPDKKKHWLSWLAQRLEENQEVDFLLEKIQFDWLQTQTQKKLYKIIVALIVGTVSMPILIIVFTNLNNIVDIDNFMAINVFDKNPKFSLAVISIIISLIFGSVISLISPKINPVETLKFPDQELIKALKFPSLKERFVGGLINNIKIHNNETINSAIASLIDISLMTVIGMLAPITAIFRGLIRGLKGPELNIKRRDFPNQGIYKSLLNAVIYAATCALLSSLVGLVYFWIDGQQSINPNDINLISYLLIWGLLGLLAGGLYPGRAVIQHITLRLILSWNNYIPCNYVKFLEEFTEKKLLERIGGRYRFIHRLLQEYLANFAKYG